MDDDDKPSLSPGCSQVDLIYAGGLMLMLGLAAGVLVQS